MTKQVIIIDDDKDVRTLLQNSLTAEGYGVQTFAGGAGILDILSCTPCDLVLIDVDLPDTDGFAITRRIRERFDVGIIIITGRSNLNDRVVGLEVGADDYIVKPFELKEIHARIRSVLRRQKRMQPPTSPIPNGGWIAFDGWTLNMASRTLRDRAGNAVALTTGEYKLLEKLARKPGQIMSRAQLLEAMYEDDPPVIDRSIDVGIMRLRKKLGDDYDTPRLIRTVRNEGYIFVAAVTASGDGEKR